MRPRFYDQSRWVTVLEGTWWVGEGEVFKTDKLVPVREGGVMYLPANLRADDEAAAAGGAQEGDVWNVKRIDQSPPQKSTFMPILTSIPR